MCFIPELTALIQSLKTLNPNVLEVTNFVLLVIYNWVSDEKALGDSRYAMLFVKNANNKIFNNTRPLLPDQRSLKWKYYMPVL